MTIIRTTDTNIQLNTTKIFYVPTYNINFIRYLVSVVSAVVCVCNKMHTKIYTGFIITTTVALDLRGTLKF